MVTLLPEVTTLLFKVTAIFSVVTTLLFKVTALFSVVATSLSKVTALFSVVATLLFKAVALFPEATTSLCNVVAWFPIAAMLPSKACHFLQQANLAVAQGALLRPAHWIVCPRQGKLFPIYFKPTASPTFGELREVQVERYDDRLPGVGEESMDWQKLSMDKFACYRSQEGMKLTKVDGIWWAEVRPFFYRPLFPFCQIKPWSTRYPIRCALGGLLHAVPDSVHTTTCMKFHVYDELPDYSLEMLTSNKRRLTRRGIERFRARALASAEELVAEGYEVYREFNARTNYYYQKERIFKDRFKAWAENLFAFPEINKTGFFLDGKLVAMETSFRIDDIIFADNLFSNDLGLKLNVVDFVQHTLREGASHTDAKYLFLGLPTGKSSLDSSKVEKGCKVLKMPAYYKVNPFAVCAAKYLMKQSYQKLLTIVDR